MPPFEPGVSGNPSGGRKDGEPRAKRRPNLLSAGYKELLGLPIPQDIRERIQGATDGMTWAQAISLQLVKKAVGAVADDQICFVAIKELRETTEGKTPERAVVASGNEELANLAKIMNGEPAPPDGDDPVVDEDRNTEESEEDFHEDGRDQE